MTTNVIDTSFHGTSFPTGYVGVGTLIGNPVNAAGVVERVNGFFTSNGNATQINIGFRPLHIQVINTTDGITWEWFYGMPAANSLKTVLSGPTLTQDTGSAFVVTGDNNVNTVTLSTTVNGTAKNIVYNIEG